MALLDTVDPTGMDEFSVVFTDRSLNHMSGVFQQVMRDISDLLKEVYNADAVALIPGGGTYGMEAVARQFARDKDVLVVRNGWFSYRWSQIIETGGLTANATVMKARMQGNDAPAPFAPAPIEDVVAAIRAEKPAGVFAPHVETSAGLILPDAYIAEMAAAAHEVDALMVLDCIASGCVWIDMKALGVDVLISAPQKGWSASPCSALVMMSELARTHIEGTASSSFACDLKKWMQIMEAYENGGHAYHATMPTDGLRTFAAVMQETKALGFNNTKQWQIELGSRVRALLSERGIASVAAAGFEAPGVVVSYTTDAAFQNGSKFAAEGLQIAAGVPLQCDEPEGFQTFRLGLFGLDKLQNIDRTVESLRTTLNKLLA